MEVRVLGSYGSRVPGHQTSCFLVDRRLAIDAGGLTGMLQMQEQIAIDHVLISHAHLDHIYDLAFLVDNVMTARHQPLRIWAPEQVLAMLRQHLFNDQIWPDMSSIQVNGCPVMELCPLFPGQINQVGPYQVRWEKTAHPVFSAGYLVSDEQVAILYTGDTTTTDALWTLGRQSERLALLFAEASFPNCMVDLARQTGHLTPLLLAEELQKLDRPELPVKIYHMKPQYIEEISRELMDLNANYQILQGNETYQL